MKEAEQNGASTPTDGRSLSAEYWVLFSLVVLIGISTCYFLPYKRFTLSFDPNLRVPVRVTRFSGAEEIYLNGRWHSLNGRLLDSSVSQQVSMDARTLEKSEVGVNVELDVKNSTAWAIQEVLLGTTTKVGQTKASTLSLVGLVDCGVRPHSVGQAVLSLSRDIEPSNLRVLATVGWPQ